MKINNLQKLLKEAETNKQAIAEAIGTTTRQLQRYQNGESEPTASKIKAICEYFNVSADWLLDINL